MIDHLTTQTESVENFLKAVYVLQQSMERVSTNALADALGVKAPSVTDMARRMEDAGLVNYQKYRGVLLTNEGRAVALKVIRRHRLIELYLVEELGYALQEVHDEAERLEHAVSDRFIEALADKLGHPSTDPHGDPIPAADGSITDRDLLALNALPLHTPAHIARLQSENAEMLRYILDREFRLEALVEVVAREPFDGPLTIRLGGQLTILGHNVAACILVEPLTPA
ncbi:MAG: metal-dependent transcriptional regulator [Armatimonadetes bacterium]|nr:metal-dependent transcriptional regulator [Anaerolineae bacterium]